MNKGLRSLLDVLLFVVMFILIQFVVELGGSVIYGQYKSIPIQQVVQGMASGSFSDLLAICTVVSGVLTVLLFTLLKWAPVSRHWLRTRPWAVLFWVAMLSLGIILPAEWMYEKMQIVMPESTQVLFEGVMKEPWGYVAVGILASIAEEIVFRGAVLRSLLNVFDVRWHWLPIVVSALIFAAIHMNLAQGVHAFVIGLLLGWMYYRTHSVIPGILLHWINNTIAYVLFNLMPQVSGGKLIDLFSGNDRTMYMGLFFSLLILLPSIFQLAIRMKR